ESRLQFVSGCAIRSQKSCAFLRDAVALPAAVFGVDARIAHVVEPRERWVDHARAWAVAAAGALLDQFDELVTVARLLGDHREHHEAQAAVVEQSTATVVPVVVVPVLAVRAVAMAAAFEWVSHDASRYI